jgi:hypothetical protein
MKNSDGIKDALIEYYPSIMAGRNADMMIQKREDKKM